MYKIEMFGECSTHDREEIRTKLQTWRLDTTWKTLAYTLWEDNIKMD
jgi:hypothetical protein